jgi:hypothetical protein
MRRLALLCLMLPFACSPETPAPPSTPPTATTSTTVTTAPPVVTQTSVPELQKGTYDEAMLWLRSTNGFRFVLDDAGVHAEGEMTRKTRGAEKVQFRANGTEWLAEATPQGVAWKRRAGGTWKAADSPDFGARIYQRVTVVFDPQKKEGVPLLESTEGDTNLYRFTNANTGEVHEVWVRKDSSIARMKIGEKVELKIGG